MSPNKFFPNGSQRKFQGGSTSFRGGSFLDHAGRKFPGIIQRDNKLDFPGIGIARNQGPFFFPYNIFFSFNNYAPLVATPAPGPRVVLPVQDRKIHFRQGQGVKMLRNHHFPCGADVF